MGVISPVGFLIETVGRVGTKGQLLPRPNVLLAGLDRGPVFEPGF